MLWSILKRLVEGGLVEVWDLEDWFRDSISEVFKCVEIFWRGLVLSIGLVNYHQFSDVVVCGEHDRGLLVLIGQSAAGSVHHKCRNNLLVALLCGKVKRCVTVCVLSVDVRAES